MGKLKEDCTLTAPLLNAMLILDNLRLFGAALQASAALPGNANTGWAACLYSPPIQRLTQAPDSYIILQEDDK